MHLRKKAIAACAAAFALAAVQGACASERAPASTVRVNQLGYLPDGPKRATIISDAAEPTTFSVADRSGAIVFSGKTVPRGFDPTAGFSVHTADFSPLATTGEGFTLRVSGEESHPFRIAGGLYDGLRHDALVFFYLARSGIVIDPAFVGEAYARPAGHVSAPGTGDINQGDRDVPCQPPEVSADIYGEPWTCDYTLSPMGGWYDAGDHGKYVVNGGIAVSQLMTAFEWSRALGEASLLGDGTLPVPERGNGIPDILDEARWELDFIERMIVPEGEPLAGMVHHKIHDAEWTGLPLLPHEDPRRRELHRPSTAATLNAAAVFAQAARVFEAYDPDYAEHALGLAERTWSAANEHPDLIAPAEDDIGGGSYADSGLGDEFLWAAAELYRTTEERRYLDDVRDSSLLAPGWYRAEAFDWANLETYARLQLAMHAGGLDADIASSASGAVVEHADRLLASSSGNPFGHAYAPEDGEYGWGSSHLVVQNALVLAAAHELTGEPAYRDAAIESADYLFGRNALDRSYVTGYGTVFSRNQHSRWFAHQIDSALPHPPPGSLAGGPNTGLQDTVVQARFGREGCAPQTCYVDDIESWSTNEITINWNGALVQFAVWLAAQ